MPQPNRMLYIDNLRLYIIVIVVMIHFAITYSGIGGWYYVEVHHLDLFSQLFFSFFHMFTQTYFLAVLFLISGYFAERSYARKGCRHFVVDRLVRLGLPTLLYTLVLNPFILYYLLDLAWIRPKPALGSYYLHYLAQGNVIDGNGPLWFALALLVFSLVYAGVRQIAGDREPRALPLPTTLHILGVILLITVATFLVRLVQPIGTSIINMQLCYFSQYIVLFIVGILAARSGWFDAFPARLGWRWLFGGCVLGAITWALLIVYGGALHGLIYRYNGGRYWQSAATALWGTAVGMALCIGLLTLFRERFNRQSPPVKFCADNAFAVYVTHAPLTIALSLALQSWPASPAAQILRHGSPRPYHLLPVRRTGHPAGAVFEVDPVM